MKLGVTGSRRGATRKQQRVLESLIRNLVSTELHHGDCVGVDAIAHDAAVANGIKVVIHPPTNSKQRAFCKAAAMLPMKPYAQRNADIVKSIDWLIAVPSQDAEVLRSGTWQTIRMARRLGKRIIIIRSDGSTN